MNFTYPKDEKLKSKKIIDLLFSEGKSVSKYPLRLIYLKYDFETAEPIKISVSVSKKYFKNAVDRNYFKRILRETYRLNKKIISETIDSKYCLMFFYQTTDKLAFQEINNKTIQLFEKFIKIIQLEKNEN